MIPLQLKRRYLRAQTVTVFDKLTASAFFKSLPEAVAQKPAPKPKDSNTAAQAQDEDTPMEDADEEDAEPELSASAHAELGVAHCKQALENLAAVLGEFGLRDEPELVREAIDACTEICRSPAATGTCCACERCCACECYS